MIGPKVNLENSETEMINSEEASDVGIIHKCQFCRKDFESHPLLKIHIENVHKRGPKRTKTQKCAICDSIFSNMEDLRDHYVENHNKWKQSSLCKSTVDQDQKSIHDQKSILDHQNQPWNILEEELSIATNRGMAIMYKLQYILIAIITKQIIDYLQYAIFSEIINSLLR